MTDNDLNPAVVLHMTANGLAIARSLGNRGAIKNQVIYACNLFRTDGYSKIYSANDITNFPSINLLSSAGFRISHIQNRFLIMKKRSFSLMS